MDPRTRQGGRDPAWEEALSCNNEHRAVPGQNGRGHGMANSRTQPSAMARAGGSLDQGPSCPVDVGAPTVHPGLRARVGVGVFSDVRASCSR